jgi:pyridinium-3,5-biscarboxylic acid mononucleotide synthase
MSIILIISDDNMKKILQNLINGKITADEAEKMLKPIQILELEDFAKMDTNRDIRTGFPEAVYAEGKDNQEIVKIILSCANSGRIIVTRLLNERYDAIKEHFTPLTDKGFKIYYNKKAKILLVKNFEIEKIGKIGIITSNNSDIAVAEEARIIAEEAGCIVLSSYDVLEGGIKKFFSEVRKIVKENVEVIIVIDGLEGALPSEVAGLVNMPVIGVPTSAKDNASKGGFTALHAMLQFDTLGIAVVNIDNGFGAAVLASTILKSVHRKY